MKPNIGKGDKGETEVFGKKIKKSSELAELIGKVDHLNSLIGFARSLNAHKDIDKILESVQTDLFLIGSELAGARNDFSREKTDNLKKTIEELEMGLKPLHHFIYPSGSKSSTIFQVCRSFCRIVEQTTFRVSEKEKINPNILSYLNRLSDLLFTIARLENKRDGFEEKEWS
ncbi:MAG: cob(I)yrinic acid a,c-diamide adenosyltransferase [Candidatus Aenigmarchaeota archaeon]|nr:cob(I)yrinic acid a,c-diamide adenosyltransferase [Candidatus Aenigmarchaeota archaeon]